MRIGSAWIVLMVMCTSRVEAQSGAIVLQFDPSVRDSGMGGWGASAANFWTNGESSWVNPALLGAVRGVGYDYSRVQLVPSLADDIFFTAERFRLGGFGVGVSLSGKPLDRLGFTRLDYGASEFNGKSISLYEDVDSWAVGVDLVRTVENIMRTVHVVPRDLARTFDVSIGYATKKVHAFVGPANILPDPNAGPSEGGPVELHDRGLLVRFTPYEGGSWFHRRLATPERGSLQFNVAYGLGIQNQPDERIEYDRALPSNPIARFTHHGVALRLARGVSDLRAEQLGWLVGPRTELWSLSTAVGREIESYPTPGSDRSDRKPVNRYGFEFEFLDIVALRYGYIEELGGEFDGDSFGLSAGLNYRGFAGVRYDYASVPQAEGLPEPDRHAVVTYVDGLEIARALRR